LPNVPKGDEAAGALAELASDGLFKFPKRPPPPARGAGDVAAGAPNRLGAAVAVVVAPVPAEVEAGAPNRLGLAPLGFAPNRLGVAEPPNDRPDEAGALPFVVADDAAA
jgi:hypothetical protein